MINVKPLRGDVHANMATDNGYLQVHVCPIYPPPPPPLLASCIGKNTIFIGSVPHPSERTYFLNGLYDIITTADVIVLQGMKLMHLIALRPDRSILYLLQ